FRVARRGNRHQRAPRRPRRSNGVRRRRDGARSRRRRAPDRAHARRRSVRGARSLPRRHLRRDDGRGDGVPAGADGDPGRGAARDGGHPAPPRHLAAAAALAGWGRGRADRGARRPVWRADRLRNRRPGEPDFPGALRHHPRLRAGHAIDCPAVDSHRRAPRRRRGRCGIVDAAPPEHPLDHPAMTALRLAWRTVRRYRAQTLLAITGVAVIGALLFDLLLLSRGLLLSFSDLLDRAGYDVRIVGGGGLTLRFPIADSANVVRDVASLPEVQRVVSIRLQPGRMQLPAQTRPVNVTLVGVSEGVAGVWTSVRGRGPPPGAPPVRSWWGSHWPTVSALRPVPTSA